MCSYPYYIIHVADLQGVLFLLHLRYGDGLLLFFTSFVWYTMYMNDKKENYYEICHCNYFVSLLRYCCWLESFHRYNHHVRSCLLLQQIDGGSLMSNQITYQAFYQNDELTFRASDDDQAILMAQEHNLPLVKVVRDNTVIWEQLTMF